MSWTMSYDEKSRIIFFTSDKFNLKVIHAAALSIAEIFEGGGDPRGMIVDLSEADIKLTTDDIKGLPAHFNDMALERRKIRTAIITPHEMSDLSLRLLELVYNKNGIVTKLFLEKEEAINWIMEDNTF